MKTFPRLFALLSLFALCPLAEAQPVVTNESLIQPAVAAGPDYSLYLDSKGTVWAVGDNDSGQLADGSFDNTCSRPKPVISGVQMVAAGDHHSLFLKTDGSVWASGDNWAGQLGDGTYVSKSTPVQVMTGVKAISAGDTHSLFLKMDGTVWATGANNRGQLGIGLSNATFYYAQYYAQSNTASPVQVMSGVQAISAGKGDPDGHSLFLKTDGSVWATGANGDGQLGNGSYQDQYSPVWIMSGVKAISAGEYHSVFLKTDGSVWATGLNADGQLSDGTFISKSSSTQVMTGVKAISAGYSLSLFLKADGTVYVSGEYVGGESSDGLWQSSSTPIFLIQDVKAISAGDSHFLFIKTDDSVWAVGSNEDGRLGDGNYFIATPTQVMTNVKAIAPGATAHSMFLKNDGSAWAVGNNYNGELGDSTHKSRSNPVQVMTDVKAIALGEEHSLFLKTGGGVWATGRNDSGQLGDSTFTDKSSPVQIITGVQAIAAGVEHSLFLKNDGTVWATGHNGEGQLGNSTYQNQAALVQVNSVSGVTAIASGDRHSFFLKSNGDLWGTGLNDEGQLGDGTAITKSTPFRIMSGVKALAAAHGGDHSLILKTDGSVWATGRNSSGQLGDGTWAQKNTWVQIMTGVKAMAQGSGHSLFLKTDNTVWATGSNSSGQFGNGSTVDQNMPVQVMSNVQAMGCGEYYSLFLKTDGTAWATGAQYDGILGNGAGLPSLTPVRAFTEALSVPANASLSGLTISGGALSPAFDSATINYTASVTNTVSSLTLSPTSSDSMATVQVNGTLVASGSTSNAIPLTVGSNIIPVLVTAQDGTTKTYTINVTRVPSAVATLANLTLSSGTLSPSFASTTTSYTASLANAVTSLSVVPTVSDNSSVVKVNEVIVASGAASNSIPLTVGSNTINVLVTAQDGTTRRSYLVTVNVLAPPVITAQPAAVTANQGASTSFSATATGTNLSYQWKWNGADLAGQTGATLVLNNLQGTQTGNYTVVVSNAIGSETSTAAQLTVVIPPRITAQPAAATANQGASASFSVTATGTNLSYQWKRNGADLAGETGDTLVLDNLQGTQTGFYTVVVSNAIGSVTGDDALLTVVIPPAITSQPAAATANQGASASFSVTATGTNLSYQWKKNGADLAGETGVMLVLNDLQGTQAGSYSMVVWNSAGSVTSNAAVLTVLGITSDLDRLTLKVGTPMSYAVTANPAPTTYAAKSLPAGLKISAKTGVIFGKPTKAGEYTVTLQALRKGAATLTAVKTFRVLQAPTFKLPAKVNVTRNKAFRSAPKVSAFPSASFSVVSGTLPEGITLNPTTGQISGKTGTLKGNFPVTIRGSNEAGKTDVKTVLVVK